MTLEQLRIFVEAAHYGSFTIAAERLGLTQSAVSVSIKKLEEKHNVTLFDRMGRRLVPTEAGQVLLSEAERILRDVELTIRRVESRRDDKNRYPIIACTRNAYDQWLPALAARIGGEEMPRLDLICGTSEEISSWVMRGTIDVGITEAAPSHPQLRHLGVFQDRIILCATPWRAQVLPPDISWEVLANCGPVIWEQSDLTPLIAEALNARGIDPRIIAHPYLRLTSTAAVLSVAESGRFPVFVTFRAARFFLQTGALTVLGRIEIPVKYWMIALRDREIEPLAALIAKASMV